MNIIQRFTHNILRWGYPSNMTEADSFQPVYTCRFCDGRLSQDSTGAYFHLDDYRDFADQYQEKVNRSKALRNL